MKNAKKWIPLGVVVLALAVLLAFLLRPGRTAQVTDYVVTISNRATASLKKVTIANDKGTYSLIQEDGTFTCPELADVPLDVAKVEQLVQNSCEIQAEKTIKGMFLDLSDYGLDMPRGTVEIEYEDGTTISIEIGFEDPETNGCYFKLKGDNKVYLASKEAFSFFVSGKNALLNWCLSPYAEDQETATADEITFTNAQGAVTLTHQTEPYVDGFGNEHHWKITSEETLYADDEWVDSLFSSAMRMKASEVYAYSATAQNLQDCGITENSPVLTITYHDETSTLVIGNKTEKGYYVYKKEANTIYIMAETYYTFADANFYTIATRYIVAPPMEEVASITVRSKEDDAYYMIDIQDEEAGLIEGQKLSARTFTTVYQLICSLKGEYILEEPLVQSELSEVQIIFTYKNGEQEIVSLVSYDANRYAIYINQEAHYLVRKAYAEKLFRTLKQISDGQVIDPTW